MASSERSGPVTNYNIPVTTHQQWARQEASLEGIRDLFSSKDAQAIGQLVTLLGTQATVSFLDALFGTWERAQMAAVDIPPGYNERLAAAGSTYATFGTLAHVRTLQGSVQMAGGDEQQRNAVYALLEMIAWGQEQGGLIIGSMGSLRQG